MKKILLSVGIIAIVAVGAIGATRAYFSSTASSTGNTFTAGTMELKLGSATQDYATSGITFGTGSNMAPGGPAVASDMYFKNTGSIAGNLKVNMTYDNKGTAAYDLIAKKMIVSSASFDTAIERQAYWAQQIIEDVDGGITEDTAIYRGYIVRIATGTISAGDGTLENLAPTVYGLSKITLYTTLNGSTDMAWAPNESHKETVSLMLDKSADNTVQGYGINVVVNAAMRQAADTSSQLSW